VWRKLAGESADQGNLTQAIYCLSRVIRIDPDDAVSRWDRALLLVRTGDHRKVH
jgi:general transcription factor 3C polypeptide 3 (transcription factor C subunit 4)